MSFRRLILLSLVFLSCHSISFAQLNKGFKLLRSNQNAEAEAIFLSVLEKKPKHAAGAYLGLSRVLEKRNKSYKVHISPQTVPPISLQTVPVWET
jgi:hypothetical protein